MRGPFGLSLKTLKPYNLTPQNLKPHKPHNLKT